MLLFTSAALVLDCSICCVYKYSINQLSFSFNMDLNRKEFQFCVRFFLFALCALAKFILTFHLICFVHFKFINRLNKPCFEIRNKFFHHVHKLPISIVWTTNKQNKKKMMKKLLSFFLLLLLFSFSFFFVSCCSILFIISIIFPYQIVFVFTAQEFKFFVISCLRFVSFILFYHFYFV